MRALRRSFAPILAAGSMLAALSCGGDKPAGPGEAGPPARMELVSGDGQSGTVGTELANPVVARVVDKAGRPVKGQLVNFRIAAGGGSAFAGSSITDAEGQVRERWTLGTHTSEEQRLEARAVDNATGAAIVFATFHATATADVARTVQIVTAPPTTTRSGIALVPQPVVQLADRFGNAVKQAGTAVEASLAAGDVGHALSGATSVATDANGVAHFTDLTLAGATGAATLRFAMVGSTEGATSAVQVGAGTAATITKIGGDGQAAAVGTALAESPRVRVTDAAGNPVSGETVTFSVTAGGGRVSSGTVTTDANGVATTAWTLGTTAGANTMTAAVGALSATFSATGTAPGSPTLAIVTQPSSTARVGEVLATVPVVQLRDEFGNDLALSGVAITAKTSVPRLGLALNPGRPDPAVVTTDASGRATFANLYASGPIGDFTITFSASGYSPVTSGTVALSVGDVKALAPTPSGPQQVAAASVITLTVKVQDAGANGIGGVTVAWSLNGDGSLSAASTTSGADGLTSVQMTMPGVAGMTTTVKAEGALRTTSFELTAVKGPPSIIVKLAGDNQRAPAGVGVATPPSVRVTDAGGNRLSNVTVTFAVASGGGSVTGATQTTDANGVATVGGWTLGPTVGVANTLTATAGAASATFTATAQSPSIVVSIQQPAANALVGDAVPVTATASSSAAALASVVASVGDRSVSLTQSPTSAVSWTGTLSLAGTTLGVKELLVVATDVNGQSTTASVSIRHDAPPALANAQLPHDGTVAPGSLPFRATCQDDGPSCVITVRTWDRSNGYGPVLAQAQGTLDQTVSLTSLDGKRVRLRVVATDTAGQTAIAERLVYVESSTRLARVDSVNGTILDATADRIMHGDRYTDSPDSTVTPMIWDRAARADATLTGATTPGARGYARLFAAGAIFSSAIGNTGFRPLNEWRAGTLTSLGGISSANSLDVSGNYAIWSNTTTLTRRDLTSGTNVVVSTSSGNDDNSVAPNGDVAFWVSSNGVYRYRGGVTTKLSSSTVAVFPVTDGTRVVWAVGNQIWADEGAGEVALTATRTTQPGPHTSYEVNNGWLAYVKPGSTSAFEVWLRSPDGTERLVNPSFVAGIEALSSTGDLVIASGTTRYLVTLGGQPVQIGTTLGRPIWIGGALHVAIGGTLFQVTP